MQVNENVNVANFFAIGNKVSSTKVENGKTSQKDFSSFFMASAQTSKEYTVSGDKKSVRTDSVEETKGKDVISEKKTDTEVEKTPLQEGESSNENTDVKETVEDLEIRTTKDANQKSMILNFVTEENLEDGTDITTEEMDWLLEVLGNVLQVVMNQLNMDEEQLQGTLNELGLESMDLLSNNLLKEVFLTVKEVNVSDLLVDENLNQEWNQFITEIDKEMEAFDIDFEQLAPVLENFKNSNLSVDVPERIFPKMYQDTDVKDEEQSVIPQDEELTEIEISVSDSLKRENDLAESSKDSMLDSTPDKTDTFEHLKSRVSSKKEERFENTVLQAVEQAVDRIEEVRDVGEIAVSGKEVVDQIVEQIKVRMSQDSTSLEMQLYPEHLGKIQINVISKDGVMTARIVAETEAAKQAIEGGLLNLKESMENQDLKVDAIEVMVSTTGFENRDEQQNEFQQQNNARSSRRSRMTDLEEEDNLDHAELQRMEYTGSSVSYMA